MKILKSVPLLLFVLITILLWRGLSLHPTEIPSPLINKAVPVFSLPSLMDGKKLVTNKDFLGHITLLNVWATWCYACADEHALIMQLAQNEHVVFYGLNYKDDNNAAKKWLSDNGNPYSLIAVDQEGHAAIDWGVYGTPETFVIDKKGIIRFKLIGPITENTWAKTLKPLIEKLRSETT